MKALDAIQGRANPRSLANRFRRARARKVLDAVRRAARNGRCRVLDLGGEPDYWALFDRSELQALGAEVTVVNPEPQAYAGGDPLFTFVQGDACDLTAFADDSFDLVHSNSVIEHVGDWSRMEAFAREVRRLAPAYYVQTPYQWFPIEPHFSSPFFHWFGESWRARRLMERAHGFMERPMPDMGAAMHAVQSARLLDKGQFRFLFGDARHEDERLGPLTKSLIAIRG